MGNKSPSATNNTAVIAFLDNKETAPLFKAFDADGSKGLCATELDALLKAVLDAQALKLAKASS
jgi:hypothetical protein